MALSQAYLRMYAHAAMLAEKENDLRVLKDNMFHTKHFSRDIFRPLNGLWKKWKMVPLQPNHDVGQMLQNIEVKRAQARNPKLQKLKKNILAMKKKKHL